jgi:hypothetical protein
MTKGCPAGLYHQCSRGARIASTTSRSSSSVKPRSDGLFRCNSWDGQLARLWRGRGPRGWNWWQVWQTGETLQANSLDLGRKGQFYLWPKNRLSCAAVSTSTVRWVQKSSFSDREATSPERTQTSNLKVF